MTRSPGMRVAPLLRRPVFLSLALLAIVGIAVAEDSSKFPATAPTSAPSSQPTTAPTATQVVKEGRISMKIDAAGTFLPTTAVEIRIRPEAFKGDLTIVSAA